MKRTDFGQALRLGLAAWTAFAVATALGIEHAFWASMPVWVIAQPWRGVIFERALWRLLGTLLGGGAGLTLLAVSPAPWSTALGMALLLSAGGALMHLRQGVSSYLPLMSAITVTVVVLPAMLAPSSGWHLALDRLACTVIGGMAVAVIVGLFTPRADVSGFRAEGAALVGHFEDAAVLLLSDMATPAERDTAVAETVHAGAALEAKARLVAAGSRDGYRRMAALDGILAAGLGLLEAANALEAEAEDRATARRVMAGETVALPASGPLARLAAARRALATAGADLQSVAPSGLSLPRIIPPGNPAMALRAALMAGFASLAGSSMLILTGSFAAELTAFSMAIFALVLGSMPQPHAMAPKLGTGVVIGAVAGTAYRLGVQPYVDGWAMLVLTLLPIIALGALARATPRSAPYALDANMCFMLASQAGAAAAPAPDVIVSGLSMTVGTLALVACYMALPRPGSHLIDRARDGLSRDLRSQARDPAGRHSWAALWGRRLVTLAVELDKAGEPLPRTLLKLASDGHSELDSRDAEREAPSSGAAAAS